MRRGAWPASATSATGFASSGLRSDLAELLAPADLFCLASTEESFGLSALEAMSAGTAVLGTRVGGVAEVVTDGTTGVLVDPEDRAAYASEMARLLGDRQGAARLGVAARDRAVARFDRRKVVEEYESLYRGLVGDAGPCP